MVLERGTLLNNRYRIIEILGQGGMGSIYRAIDENLGVEVAVKDNFFTTEEYARQFKREAIILANLRHPNLPRVTDHFVISGQGQYLVMDFIEGEDLRQRMERIGTLPEDEVITIGAAVCDALSYLGSRNPPVIHRDLKPGNVRITPQGEIYLVDFGLAKTMHDVHTTATGARAMTPGYSPPEQYGTARTDQRSDIYSLGATLYAALTNLIPEDGLARAMDQAELTPLRKLNPRISRRLASVIEKSLRVRPDERYQNGEEFKAALLNASSLPRRKENGQGVTPAPPNVSALELQGSSNGDVSEPPGAGVNNDSYVSPMPVAVPERISKTPRKNKLWLRILAATIFILLVSFFIINPREVIQDFLKNLPVGVAIVNTPTATRLPASLTATIPPKMTASSTASAILSTLGPTDTPYPTQTNTPAPSLTNTPQPTPLGGARQIAFASKRLGRPQIFVINSDGTGERQVTDLVDGACQPDWSPDGTRLIFISPCKDNLNYYPTSSLFLINLDGTGLLPLPKLSGGDFDPKWSPDGSKIAFASTRNTGRPQIFISDVTGQEYKNISEKYSYETQPSWSPNGQQLLYISTRGNEQQIWIMDLLGLNRRQVSRSTGYLNFLPSFFPDGKKILFTQRLRPDSIPFLTISPFDVEPYVEYRLGKDDPMPMLEGVISPDGLWIVFEGWTGETGHDIYVMTVTGLARTRITTDPAVDFDPTWSPLSQ